MSVHATKRQWSHASQTTSECCLSDRISVVSSICAGVVHTCSSSCPLVIGSLRTDDLTSSEQPVSVSCLNKTPVREIRHHHGGYQLAFVNSVCLPQTVCPFIWQGAFGASCHSTTAQNGSIVWNGQGALKKQQLAVRASTALKNKINILAPIYCISSTSVSMVVNKKATWYNKCHYNCRALLALLIKR